MNLSAAKIIAESFLKGAGDVFEAMLSITFQYEVESPQALTQGLAEALLKDHSVLMKGRIENNLGSVGLLFSVADAVRLVDLIQGTESGGKESLDDGDRGMLQEIAEPTLGGGVANLMERFKKGVQQLEGVSLNDKGPSAAPELMELLGEAPTAVAFQITSPAGFQDKTIFVYSQRLENLVPSEAPASSAAPPPAPPPTPAAAPKASETPAAAALSPAEMQDILGDLSPQKGRKKMADAGNDFMGDIRGGAENLDVVLDIRLEATARLGRVEMPISSILGLGPGSIVEVGHMVDEPVDLYVNNKLIARGDVVVVDEKFGLRITEIVSARERIESLH